MLDQKIMSFGYFTWRRMCLNTWMISDNFKFFRPLSLVFLPVAHVTVNDLVCSSPAAVRYLPSGRSQWGRFLSVRRGACPRKPPSRDLNSSVIFQPPFLNSNVISSHMCFAAPSIFGRSLILSCPGGWDCCLDEFW